ncbi:MAG: MFS transporter [Betaproteobacteria bacterium]|jgi:MFS family permease
MFPKSFYELTTYRIGATLSYQILTVTAGWHIYEITHNVISLGLIGLAEVIPYFLTALFSGYAVDHFSKKKLSILGVSVHLLIGIMMTLAILGYFNILELELSWFVYISMGLAGLARSLVRPTYLTIMTQIIDRNDLPRANAFGSVMYQIAAISGPMIGGFLIAWLGLIFSYAASGLCALIGLIAIIYLRFEDVRNISSHSVFKSISEGLHFVFSKKVILSVLALDMFAVLFGGAISMLPAFISEILHGNPENLGLLRAAPAIGSTAVGIWLTRHPVDKNAGKYLMLSVAFFGFSIMMFGLSNNFYVAAFFLFLTGIFDGISVIIRNIIIVLSTPQSMQGRVSAINGLFVGSSNEIGSLESGFAASILGLAPSIIFGGAMTIFIVFGCYFSTPELKKLRVKDLHQ